MMFFPAAKIFWFLCAPSKLLLWTSLAAALLLMTRHQRTGKVLAILSAGIFAIIGVVPTYIWLLRPLEHRFDPQAHPAHVDGILTLGGGLDYRIRLVETYALARRYPAARVVYSGGSGALIDGHPNVDAAMAQDVLLALGLSPDRLILEGQSRNTWENILFTQKLVKPRPDQIWLLATSGYQLPRAMEIARRLNWKLIPWPTDHVTARHGFSDFFKISKNLWNFDNVVRERIGLLAYRSSGMAAPGAK